MSIKKYSYKKQGNVNCSSHTKVREMASIGGGKLYSDTVLVDTRLMEMTERLFCKLRCSKYMISSGYRSPTHDKAVGGNGKGYHTKGKALDACFYDSEGKVIPAQIVCCVADDLGFGGIANISSNRRFVHLDVRSGKKYRGDETKGTNSVTDDFYSYFGVSKADIAKYTGEKITEYYKKYSGSSEKVDTVLRAIGVPKSYIGSWKRRKPLASKNGIKGYIGLATQNRKIISLSIKGRLKKV